MAVSRLSVLPGAEPAPVLLAHWTFDEPSGERCVDATGGGADAALQASGGGRIERDVGVLGYALRLSGRHHLRTPPGKPSLGALEAVSLSAWVLPTGFERYNEIFRKEDGSQRLLFSFQETGTILSLGLCVGGYVECDAPLAPEEVLDGTWHHCAGTFDGRWLRVYLDGREIGRLERPGSVSAGGDAPACIGSSNGGECFQGALDDLRLYRGALTADAVAAFHAEGRRRLAALAEPAPADEPEGTPALLAHYTFNEPGPVPTVRNSAPAGGLNVQGDRPIRRVRGVHGKAVSLQGPHRLRLEGEMPGDLRQVTIAAWVRPTDLSGYREVLRQECPERILLSFQGDGAILSLGLHVGGTIECDAPTEASGLLDGLWHHCAGTFDGRVMRVYLDGREIGFLERPGVLEVNPAAPVFLASSGGTSEFFEGSLDEVRLYGEALDAGAVARLHDAGRAALDRFGRELEARRADVLVEEGSFAKTVAATRGRLVARPGALDADLEDAIIGKLLRLYPEECARFRDWSGASVLSYLRTADDSFHRETVARLVELMLEYRPLDEAQRRRLSPVQRRHWQEAEAVAARHQALLAEGAAARFRPDWVELVLETGSRIAFRPSQREAVAPYGTPETPPPRALTGAEARSQLERDWLHQAGPDPKPERIRAEIAWARELAARLARDSGGRLDFAAELADLDEAEGLIDEASPFDPELYFRVRTVKRAIHFRNPCLDFERLVLVDMPFPQGSEWRHETRHRLGYMAVPGARLLVLDGLGPEGNPRQLMPRGPFHGSFWRPDVSWDGRRVLFCFKPHNEKSFHLYEVGADGSGLRQLTDGPFDDLDPICLPDDQHILFSTTRGHTYVRCMPPTNAFLLARCDRNGRNIYLISANNEPDYLPSVMHDGRILYTRWEYTDKPLWRAQGLWTVNPDGTQGNTFWGNQSVWPDLLKDARAIPGSRRVMFTGSAHHNWFAGSVGIVDPDRGLNFPHGLTKVTAD
ncbi:MAG: hypothetical protein JXR77_10325, partial [Lentisphaeria bacterium]|nr:hypothetical protein [Lentisphaeria bacterium]